MELPSRIMNWGTEDTPIRDALETAGTAAPDLFGAAEVAVRVRAYLALAGVTEPALSTQAEAIASTIASRETSHACLDVAMCAAERFVLEARPTVPVEPGAAAPEITRTCMASQPLVHGLSRLQARPAAIIRLLTGFVKRLPQILATTS